MLDKWFTEVNKGQDLFKAICDFLFALGYQVKDKTSKNYRFDFLKKGKTIARFQNNPIYGPSLFICFYATRSYSAFFHEKVRETIKDSKRHQAVTEKPLIGYTYIYPTGQSLYGNPTKLIDLGLPSDVYLSEIKELLKTQDTYWILGGK